jgi:hypothetical protein
MDPAKLVAQLAYHGKLPVEAIHEPRACRAEMTPILVETIDKFVSGADRSTIESIWVIFHLLGEWREKSAYRALARLMRCPAEDIDEIFAGTETDTAHRSLLPFSTAIRARSMRRFASQQRTSSSARACSMRSRW